MKTITLSPQQMAARIARLSGRKSSRFYTVDPGVPPELYEALVPPIYVMMMGAEHSGDTPITGHPDAGFAIVDCPPGGKVPLHAHPDATEIFLCLRGQFKIRWNDDASGETLIEPFDMISIPPKLYRSFENVTSEPGFLLAISLDKPGHVGPEDFVVIHPKDSDALAKRFGASVLKKAEDSVGMRFLFSDE